MVRKTKVFVLSFDERKRVTDLVVLLVRVRQRTLKAKNEQKAKKVKSKTSQKTKLKLKDIGLCKNKPVFIFQSCFYS